MSGADARCTVFPTVAEATRLWIKGQNFSLKALLGNELQVLLEPSSVTP